MICCNDVCYLSVGPLGPSSSFIIKYLRIRKEKGNTRVCMVVLIKADFGPQITIV